jgi:hypothetical protein
MLEQEIINAQRQVRTDAYQMSIGEIVSMYENGEIKIDPEFQRLFRWDTSQKSKLIESLLLGIPLPPIFVFEREDASWELIDGLQRVSTILEFMGLLRASEGGSITPSILDATKYLPSLYNAVWEASEAIEEVPVDQQKPLGKSGQLAIRRSRIGVEILKRPSDEQTKFDLFQRLNAGGTQANPQELRNCIMLMANRSFYLATKEGAEDEAFGTIFDLTDEAREKQRHLELAVRFLVHLNLGYDGKLDVEEYIDHGIVELSSQLQPQEARAQLIDTFSLLREVNGRDTLRRFDGASYTGKAGLVGLEAIAVGVAANLAEIRRQASPVQFIKARIESFWAQQEIRSFLSPGLRGTTRIQRTVPFGKRWFKP